MGNNYHHKPKKKKSFLDESYVPPYDAELLSKSIDILKLSDAVKEKLQKGGINTIFDVVRRCEKDFYRIPTFDKRNLGEVKSALNNKRMRLKPNPEVAPAPQKADAPKEKVQESKGQENKPSNKNAQQQKREDKGVKKENNRTQNGASNKNENRTRDKHQDTKPQNARAEQAKNPKNQKGDKSAYETISEKRTKEYKS